MIHKAKLTVAFAAVLLAIFTLNISVQVDAQSGATYTAVEAAKHINETATVIDRVDGVHQSSRGNIFLNMGGKYPNQAFTAFIPARNASQFSGMQNYENKTISVLGKITLYKGKPEIVVTSPSQIRAQ